MTSHRRNSNEACQRVEVECQTGEEEGRICNIWFPVCHVSTAFESPLLMPNIEQEISACLQRLTSTTNVQFLYLDKQLLKDSF